MQVYLAKLALLGVLMLFAGLSLATLSDFWTFLPKFLMEEREEMRGRARFFFSSGSVSISRLQETVNAQGVTVTTDLQTDTLSLWSSEMTPGIGRLFLFLKVNLTFSNDEDRVIILEKNKVFEN